jgi:hypothetical protein
MQRKEVPWLARTILAGSVAAPNLLITGLLPNYHAAIVSLLLKIKATNYSIAPVHRLVFPKY